MENYERLQEIGKGIILFFVLTLVQEATGQCTKLRGSLMDRSWFGRSSTMAK